MPVLDVLALVAGIVLVAVTFYDLFQSVVLPRPAVGKVRIALVILSWTWRGWRAVCTRTASIARREALLSIYAPAMAVGLLVIWAVAMVIGFGLVLWALRMQVR